MARQKRAPASAGRTSVGNVPAIAVVGLGCRYPGAESPTQLWQNILARRQQFRPMPDVRLPMADYQHDDPRHPDTTYGRLAAVIDGYEFDWAGRRIPKGTADATDLAHWLALDTALQMLEDAGYDAARLPREGTQVIVGNTLTGEFTRSNTLRGRWPFVRKTLRAAAPAAGLPADMLELLERQMESVFKSPFAPVTEDTLAGGLANTIAGRISNYLNVNGGGYTVDGACCASLIAVYTGAASLAAGQSDFVIAGGVDISLDPFELVGFAKTGALTPTAMRVYDARGNGFIPGEGCGFVGLKRLADAERDGDKIYAVLDGWGMSSDGRGGITAPSVDGQHLSLARAYRQADTDPGALDFIEGHGTGTSLGDKTELLAIAKTLGGGSGGDRHCGVTSFKSIVGHTKAAAGIGAFIKGVMAVNQRVLPPTAGCEQPHPVFAGEGRTMYPLLRGEARPAQSRLRAGVSAMGFGGINVHVTLASPQTPPQAVLGGALDARASMASVQNNELFVLAGRDAADLSARVAALREQALGMSQAELADLAAHCAATTAPALRCRAAVLAATPAELLERLDAVAQALRQPLPAQPRLELAQGYAIGQRAQAPRIGFLFPGQGSQQLGMARSLIERYGWARDLCAQAQRWAEEAGTPGLTEAIWPNLDRHPLPAEREPLTQALRQTELAQPAITLAALLWLRQLEHLGLQADCVLGHSLGELTAFHAAGAFEARELIQLAVLRGQRMAARDGAAGAMASLACARERASALLEACAAHGYAVLANINSDEQTIVSGEAAAIEAVIELAEREGVRTHRLAVSNAFHSRLVEDAAAHLREHAPLPERPLALTRELLSSCDGRAVTADCALRAHFGEQILRPVEFVAAASELARRCDLLLEVGPGRVLSQLLGRISGAGGIACLPLEGEAEGHADLNRALAAAHVHGADIAWDALYSVRVLRPFVPAAQRSFIVNPCERPLDVPAAIPSRALAAANPIDALALPRAANADAAAPLAANGVLVDTAIAHFQDYLAQRGQFLADVIRADLRGLAPRAPETIAPVVVAPLVAQTAAPIALAITPAAPTAVATVVTQPTQSTAASVLEQVAQATGFAASTLSLSMSMGNDLNLDSIKAGEVVARIAQRYDLGGRFDPADFAQRPLADLVAQIDALREPAAAATQDAAVDVRALLRRLVAQVTGFAEASVHDGLRLTDDLNLDSIKAGALIADAARELGVAGQLDAGELAGADLDTIATRLEQLRPVVAAPTAAATPNRDALALLTAALARLTGFAPAQIAPELRMVDDLNLDSIKAGAVVAEVAGALGLAGSVDPSERAGASIGELARWLQSLATPTAAAIPSPAPAPMQANADADAPTWARAYTLTLAAEPAAVATLPELQGARVFLQAHADDARLAEALSARLSEAGAQVLRDESELGEAALDHYVALLPQVSALHGHAQAEDVPALIAPLHRAADASLRLRCRSLAFVQFGLGSELRERSGARAADAMRSGTVSLDGSCAQAFAASVHLERTDWALRVLDFDALARDADIADDLHAALDGQPGYRAVHVDAERQRWRFVPRVLDSAALPPRPIRWSADDLVLVTGGGKGITAELAFAFAQRTGACMALVGSTPLRSGDPGSAEVEATLARYAAAGLPARYYACDLGNRDAVAALVEEIHRRDGAITGVLHGAGHNKPRRVEQATAQQALDEIRPKLCGLLHLCEALESQPPKMIVALGSIIGVTGMPGNAWYAFSNQALDAALANFQSRHAGTAVLTLAYSVWAEVGMGARLGSVQRLAQQGISAISSAAGIEQFLALVGQQTPSRQVIVAGRLHGLDTWQPDRTALQRPARFLERVDVFEPGVELIARAQLDLRSDLYLRDHYYRGVYLFPTVFGLEAMTQAALAVAGGEVGPSYRFESVQLERPIVVDGSRGTQIELRAWVRPRTDAGEPLRVEVGIRTEQSGFKRDHFAAVLVLEPLAPTVDPHLPQPQEPLDQLDPAVDLYGGLLFQGEVFQRLRTVYDLDRDGSQTRIARHLDARYFGDGLPAALAAGDPSFRDGLLQTAQLSEQGQFLPVGIAAIEVHDRAGAIDGALRVRNRIIARSADTLECEVTAYDDQGRIVERLLGYRLKRMHLDPASPQPEDWRDPSQRDRRLLDVALQRACSALGARPPQLAFAFAPHLSRMDRARRRLSELPLFLDAINTVLPVGEHALSGELEVHWDDSGKPLLAGLQDRRLGLSLSHDESHCLAICGPEPQGCDIEPVVAREQDTWRALLGDARMPLMRALMAAGDERDIAGTRLWCALETARKALGAGTIALELGARDGDAVAWSAAIGEARAVLITFPMTPTRPRPKMFAFTVAAASVDETTAAARIVAATTLPAALPPGASDDDSLRLYTGQGGYGETYTASRFRVPFKDVTSRRHGLSFPVFADWMGNLRELSIVGIGRELVPDFASGAWGMVTNHSDIAIVGDAACLDRVEGRLWISRVYGKLDSSVDMHFDWVRIGEDGSESRIAYSNMATTWVAIKGHGVVELAPFPDYLRDFTRGYLPVATLPRAPVELRRPMSEPLAALAFAGAPLYTAPAAPRVEPELARRVFTTSLEESNLVGNIYFSNYYHWQSRLIDRCLYALAPELFRDSAGGSLHCMRSKVQHLREAMPFDDIEVSMALKQLYANGLRLHFEYHHRAADGRLTKLAVGEVDCVWVAGSGEAAALPEPIRAGLLAHCEGRLAGVA